MYKGKHTRKAPSHKRISALVVSLVLILTLGIGATLAWLTDQTPGLVNEFTPASVPPTIEEKFENNVKENVKVTNGGNVRAYARAAIVVTWQDAQGNIAPTVPVLGTDYTMTTITTDGWSAQQADGYYYYGGILEPEATSGVLISEAKQLKKYDEAGSYQLVIEILAQTIQADGVDAKGNKPIELAWGVDIENGELKAATIVTE